MSAPASSILVLAGEKFACLKLVGRANFTSSLDFRKVVTELRDQGCVCFVLDLSECTLMDSTFLGVLAGLGLKLNGQAAEPQDRAIELLNPNERITELLDSLGVLNLFRLSRGPLQLPEDVRERPCAPATATKAEAAQACLEAHQTLMDLSPANAARFKDVARFLAEDLKKPKS